MQFGKSVIFVHEAIVFGVANLMAKVYDEANGDEEVIYTGSWIVDLATGYDNTVVRTHLARILCSFCDLSRNC